MTISDRAVEILQQQIGSLMVTLAQRTAELEAAQAEVLNLSRQACDNKDTQKVGGRV